MTAARDKTTTQEHPLVGRVLGGSYRVLSVLDQGGMGTVLAAEHIRLRRPVAIKVLAAHMTKASRVYERFEQEAEIVSQLQHPHVVNVLDFAVTEEGQPYMVMELLEGETLERRLDREGTLDFISSVHIVQQIASGLAAVHATSVVHRDLKPSNVFLIDAPGEPSFVKLLDFGIGMRLVGKQRRLTGKEDILGTPNYMAPEQATCQNELVDHRTDQFALGVITYELLTGVPPFDDENVIAVLRNICQGMHVPIAAMLELPAELDAVLGRAIAKHPEDRYPSIMAFAEALLAVAECVEPRTSLAPAAGLSGVRLSRSAVTPTSITHSVLDAAEGARTAHEAGDLHEAAELGELTLMLADAYGADAEAIVRLSSELLERIFVDRLGGLHSKVVPLRAPTSVDEGMSPVTAFVASRLGAGFCVADIIDICPFNRLSTLRALSLLAGEGVIDAGSTGSFPPRPLTERRA